MVFVSMVAGGEVDKERGVVVSLTMKGVEKKIRGKQEAQKKEGCLHCAYVCHPI